MQLSLSAELDGQWCVEKEIFSMRRNVPHHTQRKDYDTWGKNYFNEKVIAIKRMQKTFLESVVSEE